MKHLHSRSLPASSRDCLSHPFPLLSLSPPSSQSLPKFPRWGPRRSRSPSNTCDPSPLPPTPSLVKPGECGCGGAGRKADKRLAVRSGSGGREGPRLTQGRGAVPRRHPRQCRGRGGEAGAHVGARAASCLLPADQLLHSPVRTLEAAALVCGVAACRGGAPGAGSGVPGANGWQ